MDGFPTFNAGVCLFKIWISSSYKAHTNIQSEHNRIAYYYRSAAMTDMNIVPNVNYTDDPNTIEKFTEGVAILASAGCPIDPTDPVSSVRHHAWDIGAPFQ